MRTLDLGVWFLLGGGLGSALACDGGAAKDDAERPRASDSTAAASAAAPVTASAGAAGSAGPSGSGAAAGGPPPVCRIEEQRDWLSWANERTGLTVTPLGDGAVAVGAAQGNSPRLLRIASDGAISLSTPKVRADGPLSRTLDAKEGRRDLHRVTPALSAGGALVAFADYRDKYEDEGKRRIACVATDRDEGSAVFDGEPLLVRVAREAKEAPVDAGEPAKKKKKKKSGKAAPATSGSAAKGAPTPPADAAPDPAPETRGQADAGMVEIRDCRTIVGRSAESAFALTSELRAKEQPDGRVAWSMNLVLQPATERGAVTLRTVELGYDPDPVYTFESATAAALPGGGRLVTARYRDTLITLIVSDTGKVLRSRAHSGGWPGMVRMFEDDGRLWLFTTKTLAEDRFELRALGLASSAALLPEELPALVPVVGGGSFGEATLAIAGGQRWLSYHAGGRRNAPLQIAPVDAALAPVGRPFDVTGAGTEVYESHLFALADGRLMALAIERVGEQPTLRSYTLRCDVAP